jgi:hypothetical protein
MSLQCAFISVSVHAHSSTTQIFKHSSSLRVYVRPQLCLAWCASSVRCYLKAGDE